MIKNNKGFAPVLILIIVLGVLAVGGVAYFAGKSSAPKNEAVNNQNLQIIDQNDVSSTIDTNVPVQNTTKVSNIPSTQVSATINTAPQQTECNSKSPSSIKVLSPNGGEAYQAGQQISVKWQSCNVPNYIGVILNNTNATNWHQGNPIVLASGSYDGPTPNDGMEIFTIPSSTKTGQYKIWIRHEYDDFTGNAYEDSSDSSFTIN
jgi:Tfp pilus assembly protein PilV